jgi:hypothetical protein
MLPEFLALLDDVWGEKITAVYMNLWLLKKDSAVKLVIRTYKCRAGSVLDRHLQVHRITTPKHHISERDTCNWSIIKIYQVTTLVFLLLTLLHAL